MNEAAHKRWALGERGGAELDREQRALGLAAGISAERRALGWSRQHLADRMQVAVAQVRAAEEAEGTWSEEWMQRAAEALGARGFTFEEQRASSRWTLLRDHAA